MGSDQEYLVKSFGEAMVEVSLLNPESPQFGIAGDTLNAMAATSIFGPRVEYTTRVAPDFFKDTYKKHFAKLGLNTVALDSPNSQNALYFIRNSPDGEREFQYYRKGSAASMLSVEDFDEAYLSGASAFYNSGITMAISENCAELVRKCFADAKQKKILKVFDINYRSKLWSVSEAAAAMKDFVDDIDLLFISLTDLPVLAEIYQVPLEELDLSVFKKTSKVIVQRMGHEGCVVYSKGEVMKKPAPQVSAVDTTGAGDVFAGSFLAEYLKSNDLSLASDLAVNTAAKHTTYAGGVPKASILKA